MFVNILQHHEIINEIWGIMHVIRFHLTNIEQMEARDENKNTNGLIFFTAIMENWVGLGTFNVLRLEILIDHFPLVF